MVNKFLYLDMPVGILYQYGELKHRKIKQKTELNFTVPNDGTYGSNAEVLFGGVVPNGDLFQGSKWTAQGGQEVLVDIVVKVEERHLPRQKQTHRVPIVLVGQRFLKWGAEVNLYKKII